MLIGIPISWSLCISCAAALAMKGNLPVVLLAQRLFTGVNSFPILAVPAFMVAGELMSKGGISKRIVDFSDAVAGRIHGGLAIVSIIACAFFAALTGSAIATTAAIGGIMYPEMKKRGYPGDFSAAVQAIGGTLGPVIPPSLLFVFWGITVNQSIPKLLMSGVVPGILSALALCLVAYVIARARKMPRGEGKFSFKRVLVAGKDALLALLMPLIILGGIYSGVFTPTESAAVAVVYGLVVSLFIYREIKPADLLPIFREAAVSTANMTILIMGAQLFGWLVAYLKVPTMVGNFITSVAHSPLTFMMLVILVLFIAGMFMEAVAIIVIIAPILCPVAAMYGLDPVHFAFVCVFVLCLGISTPPFGPATYVACGLSGQPFLKVCKNLIPFIATQVVMAIVFTLIPGISTWLPNLI